LVSREPVANEFAVSVPAAPAPIRSMTGFALVRRQTSAGELTISVRTVNHRGLDLHFHIGNELGVFENAMRTVLKQHLGRGHVEVRMSLQRDCEAQSGSYNRELLSRYLSSFKQACDDFELASKPDLNALLTMPGVFSGAAEPTSLDGAFEAQVIQGLAACLNELNAYREREARELCAGLVPEIEAIATASSDIERIRADAIPHFHARLRQKLLTLLGEAGISEARLIEEAALLADKSDVKEELVRLNVHTDELRRAFESGGELGKRLDFLLQEMQRETNTILSKTSGIGEAGLTITNRALGIKANIEKIREQVLNLE
jgi:uncharacterized protein (TIGR00255 family)